MQRSPTVIDRGLRSALRPFAAAVATAGALVLLAGCGGGSSQGVANVERGGNPSHAATSSSAAAGASSSARQGGLRFDSCIRAHGVVNLPDSAVSVESGQLEIRVPRNVKGEPHFQSAFRACQRELPGGGPPEKRNDVQAELAFASCMRSHGITYFPDPLPGGGFHITFDTSTPPFEAAEHACAVRPGSPGVHVDSP